MNNPTRWAYIFDLMKWLYMIRDQGASINDPKKTRNKFQRRTSITADFIVSLEARIEICRQNHDELGYAMNSVNNGVTVSIQKFDAERDIIRDLLVTVIVFPDNFLALPAAGHVAPSKNNVNGKQAIHLVTVIQNDFHD